MNIDLKPLAEMTEDEIMDCDDFSPYFEAAAEAGTLRRNPYYEKLTGKPLPSLVAFDLRPRFPTEASVDAALRRLLELEPDFGKS